MKESLDRVVGVTSYISLLGGPQFHSDLCEGELKRILAQTTGLEPERQRLFFRGKEKRDDEFLHASGAKDGAKLLLLEKHVPANVEQKVEPVMMDESMMRACEAVVRVRSEVDKLSAKVKQQYLSHLVYKICSARTIVLMHLICFRSVIGV